jgi:hypothetical protein
MNSFCPADDEQDKFFVADVYGLLQTVTLVRNNRGKVVSLDVRDVGQVRARLFLFSSSSSLI